DEIDEVRVVAERVDRIPAVDSPAQRVEERYHLVDPVDLQLIITGDRDCLVHATASRLVGMGMTSAHSKRSRKTVCVGCRSRNPSASTARAPAPVRPCRSNSMTCGAIAAPASSTILAAPSHIGPTTGSGTRPPRRTACQGVAAPGPT